MRPLSIMLTVPQSKCGDRKDLPLETRKQFSHLHPNALECRTCCARRKVRFACGCIAEGALPRDIWLATITTRMLNEYFAGWKADRKAHGGSVASSIEQVGGQTGLGEVLCALDDHRGVSRDNRALSKCGRRYDRQGGGRGQMQKLSAAKFHRGRSLSAPSFDHLVGAQQ